MIKKATKKPMIELAYLILLENKKGIKFHDLFSLIASYKGFSDAQKNDLLTSFYTDLNMDVRFTMLGANFWEIKESYLIASASDVPFSNQNRSLSYM